MEAAHTLARTAQDRHNQFAAGLALLLPTPVPHTYDPQRADLTESVIISARKGAYSQCGLTPGGWPLYFTSLEYCFHLFEAVEKLWRAAYLDE